MSFVNPATQLPCTSFSDILFPCLKYKKTLNVRYGKEDENGYFKGISYYNVEKDIEDVLLNIVPEMYRDTFKVLLMIINRDEIPPHIDSNALVVINLYLKTCGATKTTFYTEKKFDTEYTKIENQTDGYMLDDKNLDEIYSFVAKEDEAWVLDVKKPHSVKCETKNEIRIAFTLLSFTQSYEDTLKIFNIHSETSQCPL